MDKTDIIKGVAPHLIKNKVRNLKSSYIAALKFERETGQGVKENDGEATFKSKLQQVSKLLNDFHEIDLTEVLAKRFPYFEYLKMIWDDRMNVIPPRKDETIQIGPPTTETGGLYSFDDIIEYDVNDVDEPDMELINDFLPGNYNLDDMALDGDREEEVVLVGDINRDEAIVENSALINGTMAENEEVAENDPAEIAAIKVPVTTKPVTPSISLASQKLLDKVRLNKDVTTAKGAFENLVTSRDESLKLKLDLENEKFNFEKFKFSEEQKQISIKMDRDFELRQKEFESKRIDAENQKEIRLKELEVEQLKWQAILGRNVMMNV